MSQANENHSFGKICDKHPELNGERLKSNRCCLACHREATKKARKDKVGRVGTRYVGAVCLHHPELNGERMSSSATCVGCHKERSKARAVVNETNKRKRERNKKEVFVHYGGACSICGVNDMDILTIDHIDQNGSEHKKENNYVGKGSNGFYRWLRRNGFPEGFRTLCFNCNIKAYSNFKKGV